MSSKVDTFLHNQTHYLFLTFDVRGKGHWSLCPKFLVPIRFQNLTTHEGTKVSQFSVTYICYNTYPEYAWIRIVLA